MWWHGKLKEIEKQTSPLKAPKDLLDLLQLDIIYIQKPQPGRSDPFILNPFNGKKVKAPPRAAVPASAELEFHAAFEEEHGVGILTDCNSILGIGYSTDVTPFRTD